MSVVLPGALSGAVQLGYVSAASSSRVARAGMALTALMNLIEAHLPDWSKITPMSPDEPLRHA